MARSPLTFAQLLSISLTASPSRMLSIEGMSVEEAAQALYPELLEYPKRTVHELRRFGPGAPKVRVDVLAEALESKRQRLREELAQWDRDLHGLGRQVEVLERLTELAEER